MPKTTTKKPTNKTMSATTKLSKGDERSLGALAKKFAAAWATVVKGDIRGRYHLAELILNAEKKYGAASYEAYAQAIKRSPAFVYSYLAVAKRWQPGQLRALLAKAAGRVEWSHLILLSNKTRLTDDRRAEYMKKIVTEGMKPSDLQKLMYPDTAPETAVTCLDDGDPVEEHEGHALSQPTDHDAASAVEVEVDAIGGRALEPERPAPTVDGSTSLPSFAIWVRTVRRFTSSISTLAGQANLVAHQLFSGFDTATEAEPATSSVLEDLAAARVANEAWKKACEDRTKRIDEIVKGVQALVAAKTVTPVPPGDAQAPTSQPTA